MINWQYFPKSDSPTSQLFQVISVFTNRHSDIDSLTHDLASDDVLGLIRADLIAIGFKVELSKKAVDKIQVPVLFGRNGRIEKSFEADALDTSNGIVIEVEAGR